MLIKQRILRAHTAGITLRAFAALLAKAAILAGLHVQRDKTNSAAIAELATVYTMISVALAAIGHLITILAKQAMQASIHGTIHAEATAFTKLDTILAISAIVAIDHATGLTSIASRAGNILVHGFACQFLMAFRAKLAALATDVNTICAAAAEQAIIHVFLTSATIRARLIFSFST